MFQIHRSKPRWKIKEAGAGGKNNRYKKLTERREDVRIEHGDDIGLEMPRIPGVNKAALRARSLHTAPPLVEYVVDGNVRAVKPYVYKFNCFAKGRWVGKEIIDVCTKEFGAHPHAYWSRAIRCGFITVNDETVTEDYKFKNSDEFVHMTHRHEPSVTGKISLVGETESLVAVSKPSSLPMHPCGAYRYNSLLEIVTKEPVVHDQPRLYIVHRLDRVTSGLVVMAKNAEIANTISEEIRSGQTEKTYLARVKGHFPAELASFKNQFSGEELLTVRYGAAAGEEDDDGGYRGKGKKSKKRKVEEIDEAGTEDAAAGSGEAMPLQQVRDSANVGYGYDAAYAGFLLLRCPLQVLSHREGIHACNPGGKESLSAFKMMGYDRASDTSLVLCRPITGRTHQLRLHLQLLGSPIANDPCYGGALFYGDEEKRQKAARALRHMQALDLQPLSRIPHFDTSLTDDAPAMAEMAQEGAVKQSETVATGKDEIKGEDEDQRRDGEGTEEYLARTCRYCKAEKMSEVENLEAALHCDGIWLHALQYKGASGWLFRTETPDWAAPFGPLGSHESTDAATKAQTTK